MAKFTIFGGSGFIGSEFVRQLEDKGHNVVVPDRDDNSIYEVNLGTVIYSAGYGDCQKDPLNVLHANVILLSTLLEKSSFDKLIYISSTRIYMNQNDSFEDCDLIISKGDNRKLFNLTKLTAEELCLKSNKNCLIIRPSNVYGLALNSDLFLPSIVRNAINDGVINMYVAKSYEKDYISVVDLVRTVLSISEIEQVDNIINIASGFNVSADKIAQKISKNTGCIVNWHDNKIFTENFPVIDITKLKKIINFTPSNILDDIDTMIDSFKSNI